MYSPVNSANIKIPGSWNFEIEYPEDTNKSKPVSLPKSHASTALTQEQRKLNTEKKNRELVIKRLPCGDEASTYGSLKDSRGYRWVGTEKWSSSLLPKTINTRLKVFEEKPLAIGFDQLSGKESDINIKGDLSAYDFRKIGSMLELKAIELSNVNFTEDVDMVMIATLQKLQYLNINGSRNLRFSDQLAGLSKMPNLKILGLRRAEFMNHDDGAAYAFLADMKNLIALNIDRTITNEKAPGISKVKTTEDGREVRQVTNLSPIVIDSLIRLISQGTLKTLSARWCSALSDDDRSRLEEIGLNKGCEVLFT